MCIPLLQLEHTARYVVTEFGESFSSRHTAQLSQRLSSRSTGFTYRELLPHQDPEELLLHHQEDQALI